MSAAPGPSGPAPDGPSRAAAAPRSGAPGTVHWLLPVSPSAHRAGLPADWRTAAEATRTWAGICRTQDPTRWCLRSGYRTLRPGDLVWVYLSGRQELCAVGRAVAVETDADGAHHLRVAWDEDRTAALCHSPLPRSRFSQVPMSICRARPDVAELLDDTLRRLPSSDT